MRIISGTHKSRILKSPDSNDIRPTSDRAKETLFNVLNNRIDFDGMTCLDLFCGTGNLGLECISRGAEMCYFVDRHTDIVKKNVEQLCLHDKSKIVKSDVLSFLSSHSEIKFDLILCDPPYDFGEYDRLIKKLSDMKTETVLEHSGTFESDPAFEKYVYSKKKVGSVNFTMFDFENKIAE
ncbi:MAG: RsmD family RNA methyltransferase [Ignavibacteria bacterium]